MSLNSRLFLKMCIGMYKCNIPFSHFSFLIWYIFIFFLGLKSILQAIQTYIYVDSHGKVATQPLHNFSQNTFRPFKSSHSNTDPVEYLGAVHCSGEFFPLAFCRFGFWDCMNPWNAWEGKLEVASFFYHLNPCADSVHMPTILHSSISKNTKISFKPIYF